MFLWSNVFVIIAFLLSGYLSYKAGEDRGYWQAHKEFREYLEVNRIKE